jgi:hypothetical protein
MEHKPKPGEDPQSEQSKEQAESLPFDAHVSFKKGSVKGKELRQQEFLKLFAGNLFNITKTAKDVGISRRVVHKWVEMDQSFKEQMEQMKESRLDAVESVLFQKAIDGDTISCIFFLKCQGKSRGYIEQPTKHQLEIRKIDFDSDQLDALVRGASIDRNKYEDMLQLDEN